METTSTLTKSNGNKSAGTSGTQQIKQWVVEVTCEQRSPILFDAMSADEVWNVLYAGNRPLKDKTATREQVAEQKLYHNPEGGAIGFPAEMLFASLRGAGRKVKVGRSALSTAETTQLPAFLTIEDPFIELLDKDAAWIPDVRRGMMKSGTTKVACAICRPKFMLWRFKVRISVDLEGVDGLEMAHLRQLFYKAGSTQGLGSFRPSCNGPFGRFKVVDWEQTKNTDI